LELEEKVQSKLLQIKSDSNEDKDINKENDCLLVGFTGTLYFVCHTISSFYAYHISEQF
jgi:hypothetical protein